ncbi:MAG: cbb3-type cytochrome c oxidase subunit 3 [Geminicoccaceae bacterium]|nr:cbb3-type cytochrome c oxidase subunit 3 [Geminicoccaceae bacterium]
MIARQLWVVWLLIVFVLIAWWAFRPKNKKRFEQDSRIIFDDDPPKDR